MGIVTIKDIAKALGLSASTVSRALRDSYEISEATKKIVVEYAKKHNYRPNPIALSLKENKSKANYFDAMFFGKVHYQINFVEVEKVGKIEFNLFLKFISWLRGAIDINIKEIVGVKNHNLVSM